jgi:hypothetical protein
MCCKNLLTKFYLVVPVTISLACITGCVSVTTMVYSQPIVNGVRAPYARPVILEANPHVLVYVAMTNDRIVRAQDEFLIVPFYEHRQYAGKWLSPYFRLDIAGQGSAIKPPVFIIEILIASGESLVTFSPSRVCLSFTKHPSEKHCAVAMLEPGGNTPKAGSNEWYQEPDQRRPRKGVNMMPICQGAYERRNTAQDPFIDFKQLDQKQTVSSTRGHPVCVALLFDIPAIDPSESFTLNVGTLTSENNIDLKLPTIMYDQGMYETGAGLM